MITNFKIFEEVHERSVNLKSSINYNDYVILDHHYFNYKRLGEDIIIGKIHMPHVESEISRYITFDNKSYNGYYDISKIMYWSDSKEELLAFLEAQKFNI